MNTKYKFFYTLFACSFLYATNNLIAQERTYYHNGHISISALEENIALENFVKSKENKKNYKSATSAACPTIIINTLPFFDDFIQETSFYPDCSKWQDDQVTISKNAGYNQRTIGVATFDGLNAAGRPYNQMANPGQSASADTLTSQPIDLSNYNNANSLFLSFFVQPQGLGDRPEVSDSLFLEFKDSNNQWHKMNAFAGVSPAIGINDMPEFSDEMIQVKDDFLHSEFQFRFRNIGNISGNNDLWHIDYVYLDANRLPTNTLNFPDVAFTDIPVPAIKRYTAMPWNHFRDTMLNDTVIMRNWNLGTESGTLDRQYDIINQTSGQSILSMPMPALTYNPSPNNNDSTIREVSNPFTNFTLTDSCTLLSTYTILNPTDFQNNPIFALNDTVRRQTRLHNYFAYDDGTAESRVIAERTGTTVAVEFRSTVEDTLRGVYIHLPYYQNRNSENDHINVKVWIGGLNSEVFSRDFYRLRYSDYRDGFHYVEFTDFAGVPTPIYLPANIDFYVGWQQSSTVSVPIGLDRNSDASNYTYIYTGADWEPMEVKGSIMLRPFLSMDPTQDPLNVAEMPSLDLAQMPNFKIYPNPHTNAYQSLQLEWLSAQEYPTNIIIYNSLGQVIMQENITILEHEIYTMQLPTLHTGMYFVQVHTNEQKVYAQPLQIMR